MKFFTLEEIIISVFVSMMSGIVMGGIYSASYAIYVFLYRIVFVVKESFLIAGKYSSESIKSSNRRISEITVGTISKNVFEGFLFTLFGLSVIILYYILLDGIFRLYVLFLIGITFFFSSKFFGAVFNKTVKYILDFITLLLLSALGLIISPFYYVFFISRRLFRAIYAPIRNKALKSNSKRIYIKKIKIISNLKIN